MTRSQLWCEAKDISGWAGLAGGKGSLHTGIILLFNMALPCYQPVSPKVEPYHFPFSLPLCPPSPCRWISSIAWGQLQPQCLLLPLALPCTSPVESLKTERLWPEAVGLSLWGSRSSSSILHLLSPRIVVLFSRKENECLLNVSYVPATSVDINITYLI